MAVDSESAAALVRSETRVEILRRLRESPATKYELREEFPCSRTTVDRNLDRVVEAGWVEDSRNGYTITTPGEFVVEKAVAFLETESVASRLQPFLKWISREDLDIDLRALADAELTVAGEVTPLAMVDKHTNAITKSSTFKAVLPITSSQPFEVQYRRVRDGELTTSLVVTPDVAEVFLTNPQFADRTRKLLDKNNYDVSVTHEPVPYYFGLLDETVQFGVDDEGEPKALLESEDETVREWAEERFEAYREQAVPIAEWDGSD